MTLPQQKLKIFQNFKNLSPPRELTLEQNKGHFRENRPGFYKVMYYHKIPRGGGHHLKNIILSIIFTNFFHHILFIRPTC